MPGTLRLAHRGDQRRGPENSLAALQAAARLPRVDGVEFDVRVSRDGVPVVIHDATLDRVQGVPSLVRNLSAGDLDELGVPSLADVLGALPRRTFLDVELKEPLGRAGFQVLAGGRGRDLDRALVSSFLPEALEAMASLAPGWPRWLNALALDESTVRIARQLGCRGVAVEWHALEEAGVTRCRQAGLEVGAWAVTRRPTRTRLERLGLQLLCVEGAALLP
jgi:glycerophosphoryl diester phosphodiesterase